MSPMKPSTLTIVAVLLVLTIAWFGQAQSQTDATLKSTMNQKLDYAHYILNGVATENFELIATNADKLSKLSQSSSWSSHATTKATDYEILAADFRKQTDALAKAGKDRNPDAASLAYVQMTLSCINCHKYMRGKKTGGNL